MSIKKWSGVRNFLRGKPFERIGLPQNGPVWRLARFVQENDVARQAGNGR